jgi:hypothetical protein
MVERRILDDVGLFREDMTFAGDFDRWVAICKHYPIGSIKETLVYLRDHNGQLSRKKGHYVSDMRECVPIYQELMERLPLEERAYAKRYLRRYTHRMYLHYVMRSLAERDVQTAVQAYRVIREIENLPILAALWLITCNGRFFRLPPRVMCVLRAAENESQ